MRYSHITHELTLSHHQSFNNAKPNSSTLFPKPPPPPAAYGDACSCPTNLLTLGHLDLVLATNNIAKESSDKAEEMNELQGLGSSRWNPTAEQLLALEELYRRGTRTPSVAQIQQIASRLRRFGKIEGKNVFYWFQNHKARERQKRRRQLLETQQPPPPPPYDTESLDKKEPGKAIYGSLTKGCEIQQTKNKCSSNFSIFSEELIFPAAISRPKPKEKKFQQGNISSLSTLQAMDFVSCMPMQLINSKDLNTQNSSSMKPHHQENNFTTLEDENREEQTLELFPLGSNYDWNGINNFSKQKDSRVPIRAINTSFNPNPNQYFEFLPLKNN